MGDWRSVWWQGLRKRRVWNGCFLLPLLLLFVSGLGPGNKISSDATWRLLAPDHDGWRAWNGLAAMDMMLPLLRSAASRWLDNRPTGHTALLGADCGERRAVLEMLRFILPTTITSKIRILLVPPRVFSRYMVLRVACGVVYATCSCP